ncbi:probable ascorbate-specific transmembrane electron transporter 2 [Nymphaea colorata]|nr:probable ascorbate-specific transmembrane electron transporter 2 [Nymphaea colorata]
MAMAAKEKTSLGVSVTPVLLVVHLLGLIAAVLMLVWNLHYRGGLSFSAQDKQRIFNIHPVSMFIGVVFIAGEANVMYKMLPAPKKTKKLVHLLLHLAALSLGILGIYAVFKFHNEIGVAHVYSLHSWMGITTFCLFGLQWLLGFLSFWYPGLSTPRREQAVPWHALMGITIFLLTICTAETGLAEKFIFQRLVRESEAYLVNFLGLMVLLFGAAVAFCVTH